MYIIELYILFIILAFLIVITIRNELVSRFDMKILDSIFQASIKDLEKGKDFHWRYEQYRINVNYNKMVLMFWKPLKSFIKDTKFME